MTRMLVKQWTQAEITTECAGAYGAFTRGRTAAYQAYFRAHPELADPDHSYKAKDFAAALPDSSPPEFEEWLPHGERHLHHLSGNSSQLVALGLLGIAARRDASLTWWWDALGHLPGPAKPMPTFTFESKLAKPLLAETGGATSVDFYVEDDGLVICCECKWVEDGFGCTCSTTADRPGNCRPGIYANEKYWQTALDMFELPKHSGPNEPCRLGFAYQAVRNVAAALALAGENGTGVFVLLYHDENPYFAGAGDWPGWATVLARTLGDVNPQLEFRAVSWQQLVPHLPLDAVTAAWASEKHGLG